MFINVCILKQNVFFKGGRIEVECSMERKFSGKHKMYSRKMHEMVKVWLLHKQERFPCPAECL